MPIANVVTPLGADTVRMSHLMEKSDQAETEETIPLCIEPTTNVIFQTQILYSLAFSALTFSQTGITSSFKTDFMIFPFGFLGSGSSLI